MARKNSDWTGRFFATGKDAESLVKVDFVEVRAPFVRVPPAATALRKPGLVAQAVDERSGGPHGARGPGGIGSVPAVSNTALFVMITALVGAGAVAIERRQQVAA